MDSGRPPDDELAALRAEAAEWRRRAEVAEAIAAERLARAETAERALSAAEAAVGMLAPSAVHLIPPAFPSPATVGEPEPDEAGARPKSLLERWRRYTDSIT